MVLLQFPRRQRLAVAALGSCALVSCTSERGMAPADYYRADAPQRAAITKHVVIVSIDGLRPDAISASGTPTIWRLAQNGAHSWRARTILPSKTLPSHTSMLTGVPPTVHGVTWNEDETESRGTVDVPTVFGVARRSGRQTAAFFSKTKFHHLEVPGTIDHGESPPVGGAQRDATEQLAEVERHLAMGARPNLLFVHFGEPEYAGHESGWMGGAYLRAVASADDAVSRLASALDRTLGAGAYTLIITADHGGHGKTHGSGAESDVTIPWIVSGKGVRARQVLTTEIRTMDTAATALWVLGVPVPDDWAGAAVDEAFATGS